MYLMFTDETATQPGKRTPFFIYGGIFLPTGRVPTLHQAIKNIRRKYRFRPTDTLKFSTQFRPKDIDLDDFTNAKREVVRACRRNKVRFIANVVLHDLARYRQTATLVKWGANTVLGGFHKFLSEKETTGFCIFDQLPFPTSNQYLREKFQSGLIFPNGYKRDMPRIVGYASTCIGASHIASAMDIVLGQFRYCVNEWDKDEAPKIMLPPIVKMMWHKKRGDTFYVREYGLLFRPKTVDFEGHKRMYDRLTERLNGLLRSQHAE